MKITKPIFTILYIFCISLFINAQMGINTDKPSKNSVLDIKGKPGQYKGILLPRNDDTQIKKITPSTEKYLDNGLLLYNIDEECFNYWTVKDKKWKSLCGSGKRGNVSVVECKSIQVFGDFTKGTELNSSNYVLLTVDVKEAGTWAIEATSTPANGYLFMGNGVFIKTGIQTVRLMAYGMPTEATGLTPDVFTMNISGDNACTFNVTVQESMAIFLFACDEVDVFGVYEKNKVLTDAEYISIRVVVNKIGYYDIHTPEINGISFKATGIFPTTGSFNIQLKGSGTLNVAEKFDMPIISSSSGFDNTVCSVTIYAILPPFTYAILGVSNSGYSWDVTARLKPLTSTSNFGPDGIVKIQSFTQLWKTADFKTAAEYLNNGYLSTINGVTQTRKPDILLFFSGRNPNANGIQAIANYINAGGYVIYGTSDATLTTGVKPLLDAVFGTDKVPVQAQVSGVNLNTDDNTYQISNLPNDPIINGPFGNLGGKYWGEDNQSTGSFVVTKLPPHAVQIATASNIDSKAEVDPDYSIVWYSQAKNFVFFGDSVGASLTSNSASDYPTLYDNTTGLPKQKAYGSPRRFIYNAALELNAVAWAIQSAMSSGINPH